MPTLETMDRRQKAQLWPFHSRDGHGQVKVSARVEKDVRWVDGKTESVDAQGNPIALDATVVLGEEIAIDGIMWKGTLAQYNAASSHTFYRVVEVNVTPDIKNRNTRWEARLVRHSDTLPTVVS